jgi:uncharacterized protein (DUF885 family)
VILLLVSQILFSQNKNFEAVRKDFVKNYIALQIPYHQANYVQNLKSIKSIENIIQQEIFFKTVEKQLTNVDVGSLNEYQYLDYQLMKYEAELNLERISLEKQFDVTIELDDKKSIHAIENGKNWYTYLLKKWVDIAVTPDEMFQFGLDEIKKVKSRMKDVQVRSDLSEQAFQAHLNHPSFFFYNVNEIQHAFESIKREVAKKASKIFPYLDQISEVNIVQGTNVSLLHVPAYYSNGTFYFNYFNEPFNKRQSGWIYIHEGIPGHHYQNRVNNIIKRTDLQQLFWYSGFVEGWGAYVESLGNDLGVYKTIYDEYGKWEWDLIRSVRVSLDVGINYYGWSDEKALAFWKQHVKEQDDIGMREINRMKRWPAQVITYKYGANLFLKLLEKAKKGKNFDFKRFHENILKNGDIPLFVLRILAAPEDG